MAERIARRAVVHGRVQGVYFRDSTERVARQAGITGWVRNADDGTVQAHVEGAPAAVEQVLQFLREGPAQAEVHRVDVTEVEPELGQRFEVS